jgi:hypothetical protein
MAQAQLKKKYVTAEEVVAPYCQADGTLVYQPAKILKCVQIRAAKQHAYHVQFQMDTGEALTQDWFFESALKDKEEGQFAFEKIVGARRHKSTCNVKNRRCNRDTGTPCNVYFEYKVKWEDYDESKNSWEADDNVGMYSDLVLQYWADVCANNPKLLKKMNLPPVLRSRVKKYARIMRKSVIASLMVRMRMRMRVTMATAVSRMRPVGEEVRGEEVGEEVTMRPVGEEVTIRPVGEEVRGEEVRRLRRRRQIVVAGVIKLPMAKVKEKLRILLLQQLLQKL